MIEVDEKLPVPVTVNAPDANVPVVDKFSLPKLIAPQNVTSVCQCKVSYMIAAVNTPQPSVPLKGFYQN